MSSVIEYVQFKFGEKWRENFHDFDRREKDVRPYGWTHGNVSIDGHKICRCDELRIENGE